MGLYLRKSVSVGPFRFNLSKSGLGVSAGVKGFRVGAGPRGNYVHMGAHGIYYRATLPSSSPSSRTARQDPLFSPPAQLPRGGDVELHEIESADVAIIVDSSSADLLRELNEKRRKARMMPLAVVATIALVLIGASLSWPPLVLVGFLLAGVVLSWVAYNRDLLSKTAVILYEFDGELEGAYELLHKWAESLAGCSKAWHIEAQGDVRDRKYHAGASSLVRRKPTFIRKAEPPFVKTNVETIAIGVGRQVLHFFPDRVLVYDANGVGGVSYSGLRVAVNTTRFIESEGLPADAKVVDQTWRYVNKKGGPDRRFKDNRQLPICLYDEISLQSTTGLNEVIQVSRCDIGDGFAKATEYLASKSPSERTKSAV
jgi:hypothetical protein